MLRIVFGLILSFLTQVGLQGQNLEETFQLGKTNFLLGNDQTASLALERAIFFGQGKYDAEAFEMLGQIANRALQFEQAARYFGSATQASTDEVVIGRNTFFKASAHIRNEDFQLALIELLGMSDALPDTLIQAREFLLGVSYFNIQNFSDSRIHFRQAIPPEAKTQAAKIDSLFDALVAIKHPNPKTARLMSIFLPGLGQFYAGDVKNGINSLLLTGSFFTLGFIVAVNYSLVDAMVAVVPWVQRYYVGGYNRAAGIAENKKKSKQDKVYQAILLTASPN